MYYVQESTHKGRITSLYECVFVCVDADDDAEKCKTAVKAGVTVHPQALGQTQTS